MSRKLIKAVVDKQYELNKQIHPNWTSQNYNWNRAIWVECAELMDSLNYKWWKNQEIDVDNAKVEIIDILHFLLSLSIETYGTIETINMIDLIVSSEDFDYPYNYDHTKEIVDDLVAMSASYTNDIYQMFSLVFSLWVSFDDNIDNLFISYFAKQALNRLRQDYGYKEGKYKKIWNGVEDNVYIKTIKFPDDYLNGRIDEMFYKELEKHYKEINGES